MRVLVFSFRSIITMSLFLTFTISCESGKEKSESSPKTSIPKNEASIEKESEFAQYDIRYENSEGDFISVNESQLKSFVIKQFELEENQALEFVKVMNEEGNEHIKVQLVNKIGNKSQFAIFLHSMNEEDYGKNVYLIEDKICACTTCLEGCELQISDKRCDCVCPSEEDPCTKTEKEIVEGNYKRSDFES